jgi:hypothetical protein
MSGRFFLMSPTSSAIGSIRRRVPVLSFNLLRCTVEADCPFGRCKARASRLADILILFPDPDEQRQIGAYFCQWVELIVQNGAQVSKLRTDSFSKHWKLFFQPLENLPALRNPLAVPVTDGRHQSPCGGQDEGDREKADP